jgi:hypothetical protein
LGLEDGSARLGRPTVKRENKSCRRPAGVAFRFTMKRVQFLLTGATLLLGAACIHIKTDPVDVHMTVDVNVKVDRALDSFFGDLDQKSTTIIATPAQK